MAKADKIQTQAQIAKLMVEMHKQEPEPGQKKKNVVSAATRIILKRRPTEHTKSSSPIANAMRHYELKKKGLNYVRIAMSMEASRHINAGLLRSHQIKQEKDTLRPVKAAHFVYNPLLTLICAKRGEFTQAARIGSKVELELNHGVAATAPDPVNGYQYLPRNEVVLKESITSSDLEVPEEIERFNGDLDNNANSLSAILLNSIFVADLRPHLIKFIKGLDAKIPPRVVEDVVKRILSSTRPESEVKFYYPPDIRQFHTADYEVSLCNLSGWYNFKLDDNTEYRIRIHRRMILSTLRTTKAKDVPYTVPLAEEIEIQLNKKDAEEWKGFPEAYVVVSKARSATEPNAAKTSQLHFLGDNAFTVMLPSNPLLPTDKYAAIMHLVGWVQSKLQQVTCQDKAKLNDALTFFKDLVEGESSVNEYYATLIKAERTEPQEVSTVDVMKRSFLSNQHAHDLTAIQGDRHFITNQWFVSFGLGLVAISPSSDPHRSYVFVWARRLADLQPEATEQIQVPEVSAPTTARPAQKAEGGSGRVDHDIPPLLRHKSHNLPPVSRRAAAASSSYVSSLPLELELELQLL